MCALGGLGRPDGHEANGACLGLWCFGHGGRVEVMHGQVSPRQGGWDQFPIADFGGDQHWGWVCHQKVNAIDCHRKLHHGLDI